MDTIAPIVARIPEPAWPLEHIDSGRPGARHIIGARILFEHGYAFESIGPGDQHTRLPDRIVVETIGVTVADREPVRMLLDPVISSARRFTTGPRPGTVKTLRATAWPREWTIKSFSPGSRTPSAYWCPTIRTGASPIRPSPAPFINSTPSGMSAGSIGSRSGPGGKSTQSTVISTWNSPPLWRTVPQSRHMLAWHAGSPRHPRTTKHRLARSRSRQCGRALVWDHARRRKRWWATARPLT